MAAKPSAPAPAAHAPPTAIPNVIKIDQDQSWLERYQGLIGSVLAIVAALVGGFFVVRAAKRQSDAAITAAERQAAAAIEAARQQAQAAIDASLRPGIDAREREDRETARRARALALVMRTEVIEVAQQLVYAIFGFTEEGNTAAAFGHFATEMPNVPATFLLPWNDLSLLPNDMIAEAVDLRITIEDLRRTALEYGDSGKAKSAVEFPKLHQIYARRGALVGTRFIRLARALARIIDADPEAKFIAGRLQDLETTFRKVPDPEESTSEQS